MFCDERIINVYIGVRESDFVYSHHAFLDCYHDIAFHCTEGYRLVLETENYAVTLSTRGVLKEAKEALQEKDGEWLRNGIEITDDGDPPWIHTEATFFTGERLLSVTEQNKIYLLEFDDFTLKLIPHPPNENIQYIHIDNHGVFNHVFGCDRHLHNKCPHCGSDGEILLDITNDFLVRCKNCSKSTYSQMTLADAIDEWNSGYAECDLSDIKIDKGKNNEA